MSDRSLVGNSASPRLAMRRSRLAPLLLRAAAVPRLRRRALSACLRVEGGAFFSLTARQILRDHFGVSIGEYSYGCCFEPNRFPSGVSIGRFVSIADGVLVFRRNHPLERPSLHPAFYNPAVGLLSVDTLASRPLVIDHDAWIGANAIITPSCDRIGIGAVVGAGAVVTQSVDDFAIVAGNPARLIRYRFPPDLRIALLEQRWWDEPLSQLAHRLQYFLQPLEQAARSP